MNRLLYAFAMIATLVGGHTCSAQATDSAKIVKILTKCWRSIGHEYSTIYALEEEEVKAYAKQKICITRDSISMYTATTYHPTYGIKKVNAEEYSKTNFDCNKVKLGIQKDSIYEITINTYTSLVQNEKTHKMTDVIAFDGDCIFIVNDGVIFKLFDSEAKKEARGAN